MPQEFQINGVTSDYFTLSDWQDSAGSSGLDGNTPILRWRRLTLQAPDVMPQAEFNDLYALEGQRVSVTVPPYDDRNAADYRTYYGAILEQVNSQHRGPILVGVSAEFLVRV